MVRKSFIDDLTGLYNRRYLKRWIGKELARCKRYSLPLSMALLDLDDFKKINDIEGHLIGDTILIQFAEFLKDIVREADMVVRYGGAVFVFVFFYTKKNQAGAVMERIMKLIKGQHFNQHVLTASCGISSFPDDGVSWEFLFQKADRRMYQVKRVEKGGIGIKEVVGEEFRIPTPCLVGRKEEMNKCSDYSDKKEKGLIVIKGEAGVGKTRLVNETNEELIGRTLLTGASYPAMAQSPYYAARNLLQGLLDKREEIVREVFVEELSLPQKRMLSSFLPDLTHGFPEMGGDRLMLLDTITKFIDSISTKVPISILFDDLHWASESTMDLLHFLLKSRKKWYPVFGTYRTEEIKGTPYSKKIGYMGRENLYKEVLLDTLDKDSTMEMVSIVLNRKASPSLIDFIYKESGGNPFFIEEILKQIKDSRALYKSGNTYELNDRVSFNIPKTIEDTVNHKLTFLDSKIREVIDIGALIGKDFSFSLLHSITNLNEGELYDLLDQLREMQFLIEEEGHTYSFKEDVLRQVVVSKILKGTRRKLHLKIANTLERDLSDSPDKFERLAYHFYNSGESDKVTFYAEKAGDQAKSLYAHKEAIRFFKWSLSGNPDDEIAGRILSKIAAEFSIKGDYKQAIENYKKALSKIKNNKKRARIFKDLGGTYEQLGDYKNALLNLREARKMYVNKKRKYSCDPSIAWVYMEMGKEKSAARSAKRTINRLNEEEFPKEYSLAYNTLASIYLRRGKYDKALDLYNETRRIRESIKYKEGVGSVYMNMANVYSNMNDLNRAMEIYKKALDIYKDTGYKEGEISTYYNLGVLEMRRNNLEKAESYLRNALDMAEWVGGLRSKILILNSLGLILIVRGSLKEGMNLYLQSEEISRKTESPDTLVSVYSSLSTLNILYFNEIKKAEKYINMAEKLVSQIDPGITLSRFLLSKVRYKIAIEEIEEGIDIIKDSLYPMVKKIRHIPSTHNLYLLWALLYSKKGWEKWGVRYLREAMKYAKESNDVFLVADVHRIYGIFYKNLGKKRKAKDCFKKALNIYRDIQFRWYIEETEREIKEIDK